MLLMSADFRGLLKKVGSGAHTHQDLTRSEAEQAARLMLMAEATPAQIGAFLIAHRIKRPTPDELAGILDAYQSLGLFCRIWVWLIPFRSLAIPMTGVTAATRWPRWWP